MGILAELFTTGDMLLGEVERARYAKEDALARYGWDESKHPRDGGKFAEKAGGRSVEFTEEDRKNFGSPLQKERARIAAEKVASKPPEKNPLPFRGEAGSLWGEPKPVDPPLERSGEDAGSPETLLDAAKAAVAKNRPGSLIPMNDARKESGLGKEEFDRHMMDLFRSGKVSLHRHDFASGVSQEERDSLVHDTKGSYYVGYTLRDPEQYAKKSEAKWITVSGTHVQVDGKGEIVKGPAALADKLEPKDKKPAEDHEPRTFDEPKDTPEPKIFDDDDEDGKRKKVREAIKNAPKETEIKPTGSVGASDVADVLNPEARAGGGLGGAELGQAAGSLASFKPQEKTGKQSNADRIKAMPRFQRQMIDELWESHQAKNPDASRADFEDTLFDDSRKPSEKPKAPKPERKAAPKKEKPKKDPRDNLYPFAAVDKSPLPEPETVEMTDFEDEQPSAPVSTGTSPKRDTRTAADLDAELADVSAQAEAEKAKRRANKASVWETFKTWASSLMKAPDKAEYEPGSFGTMQKILAKSMHAKKGKKEQYQRQAFNRFLEAMHYENAKWITLESGTHVQLDERGQIVKGPPALADRSMASVTSPTSAPAPATPAKPAKAQPKPKAAPANPFTAPKAGTPIDPDSRKWKKHADAVGEQMAARTKSLNLSPAEVQGIKDYTALTNYRDINNTLRTLGDDPEAFKNRKSGLIYASLQESFKKAGDLPEPVTVYRGIGGQAAQAMVSACESALANGKGTITAKGITSTSIHPDVAGNFVDDDHKVIMRIKAKRGIYAEGITSSGGEYELIQNHGTRYKPVTVKKHGKKTIIDLEEV